MKTGDKPQPKLWRTMKVILARFILWPASWLLFFSLGLAAGAYYQREIMVIYHGFFPANTPLPQINSSPEQLKEISTLILPNVTDPLPLVFSDTLEENTIQQYLKNGAVVLPLGKSFGDPGNVVVTAHSSGTESFGPYRFAFAKLSELEPDNTYQIRTPAALYTYRVYSKEIVWPHEVGKLPQDDRSTVTLVTCWPLWTNFKRLLVHSELTSVDYNI